MLVAERPTLHIRRNSPRTWGPDGDSPPPPPPLKPCPRTGQDDVGHGAREEAGSLSPAIQDLLFALRARKSFAVCLR